MALCAFFSLCKRECDRGTVDSGMLDCDMTHVSGTKRPWHLRALAALVVAVLCIFIGQLSGIEGRHTFQLFGSEVGFARIKASPFVVWGGELFRFPFDWVLLLIALVATAVSIAITWDHLSLKRGNVLQR